MIKPPIIPKDKTLENLEDRLEKLEKFIRQNDIMFRKQLQQIKHDISRMNNELSNKADRR